MAKTEQLTLPSVPADDDALPRPATHESTDYAERMVAEGMQRQSSLASPTGRPMETRNILRMFESIRSKHAPADVYDDLDQFDDYDDGYF
jgi:hypothetical protein